MKLSYGELLSQALKVIWKNKFLWILGIFASIFNSVEIFKFLDQAGAHTSLLNTWNFIALNYNWTTFTILYQHSFLALVLYLLFSLLFLGIIFFFIWLAISSQISVIRHVNFSDSKSAKKENNNKMLVSDKQTFWNVFKLHLGTKILILVLGIAAIIPQATSYWLQSNFAQIFSRSFTVLLLIIFLLLAFFVYFVVLYAINYVVLKKQKTTEAIHNGVTLFTNNILISIETAIVFLIITLVISQLSLLLFKIFVVLMVVIFSFAQTLAGIGISTLILITLILIFLAVIGFVSAFQIAIWTILFNRLTTKDYKGFMHRILMKLKKQS